MRARLWLAGLLSALGAGAAVAAEDPAPCRTATFEGSGFTVCAYAPQTHELRLAWAGKDGAQGSLRALKAGLGADAARVSFAMNAGMYDPDRRPVGLYVEDGRELQPLNQATGSGNFFLEPNGVFWVDGEGRPYADETFGFALRSSRPRWATQSGPLLVHDGALHPKIAADGTSLAVRNGVGVRDGKALFVISDKPVSFGRFARFFRDGLGCPDALYLDGGISSLWAPGLGRRDRRTGLGTFVVVLRRTSPKP